MRKLLLEAPYQMHMVDAPIPEPAVDEVRVRICKIGICGSDPTIYKGLHPYVTYPMVPGHELSGVIDAVGSHVDASRIGQRVTIIPHQVCGHCEACKHEIYNFCEELKCTGAEADGGMCDYFCIDAKMALEIPETMTLEQAAMVEPACVAYHGAKRGHIGPGDRVLIVGGGPIGVFCMQSCFALGAKEVYIADMDTDRLALAKSLGATGTIEAAKEDLKQGLTRLTGSEKNIDVFFVTLNKADKDYSPTTMYNDYSINSELFHWQSQSTTSADSPTGQRYIHHRQKGSRVLLFVREFKSDRVSGSTAAYTYLGTANYVKHDGEKPMNITWKLDHPIPAKYLKKTNKLVVG